MFALNRRIQRLESGPQTGKDADYALMILLSSLMSKFPRSILLQILRILEISMIVHSAPRNTTSYEFLAWLHIHDPSQHVKQTARCGGGHQPSKPDQLRTKMREWFPSYGVAGNLVTIVTGPAKLSKTARIKEGP